ncbi:MAG TPA: 3TM-type holin [Arenicellales bacterium]|nr:3TM-type holin [Arenicellales bacterium]
MSILSTVLGGVAEKAVGVVDQFVTDKDKANELKTQLVQRFQESADAEMKAKASIIRAEATGESWLQRNWRPVLMLVIVSIVANNYLLAPYLQALFGPEAALALDLPERLWDLMTLGVGGYIAGRSGEKMIERWKAK